MQIKAIELENFKWVSTRTRIEFGQLTLLFGANNAGKSTILQSLQYLREILERQNFNAGKTLLGGEITDLGGFQSLVHKHDRSKAIRIKVEFGLEDDDLLQYSDASDKPLVDSSQIQQAGIEVAVEWSSTEQKPIATSYEVSLNGDVVARIESPLGSRITQIKNTNMEHPLLLPTQLGEWLLDDWTLKNTQSAIPNWGETLQVTSEGVEPKALHILDVVLLAPGRRLLAFLQGTRYVGPLRLIPPRNYQPELSPDESKWATGIAAWDALYHDSNLRAAVNNWLEKDAAGEERTHFGTGYQIEKRSTLVVSEAQLGQLKASLGGVTQDKIENILSNTDGKLVLSRAVGDDRIDLLPSDVGVGLSQLVPVIAASLSAQSFDRDGKTVKVELVTIEQPELHIHPAMQVVTGDLFIEASNERQLLVETHSEHLILRLLRRIRETTEKGKENKYKLTPEELCVLYVNNAANGTEITKLPVDENGDFTELWPNGFFDERMQEVY